MKSFYTFAFTAAGVVLGMLAGFAGKKKNKCRRWLTLVLVFGMAVCVSQAFVMAALNAAMANVSYAVFYISIDWLLYSVLGLCEDFTFQPPRRGVFKKVFFWYYIFDSILIATDIFTDIVYSVKAVESSGTIFYVSEFHLLYQIHLAASYIISFVIGIVLVSKLFKVSTIYWDKYILMLAGFVIVLILDALYVFSDRLIDYSVIGYALAGVLFYYDVDVYKPRVLLGKMFRGIADNECDAILLFDTDNNCIYINERAKQFFRIFDGELDRCYEAMEELLSKSHIDRTTDYYNIICATKIEGVKFHLDIEFHRLRRSGREIGYYYHIQDKTADIEALEKGKSLASHDSLTGLYNRDEFYHLVRKRLNEEKETEFCVVAADVKDFKLLNDVFGSHNGDVVLQKISDFLRGFFDDSAFVCRITGDRFCAFLRRDDFDEAALKRDVVKILDVNDINYPLSIQFGVYFIDDTELAVSQMIDRAFMAIAENKEDLRNRIFYYDSETKEKRYFEQRLTGDLLDSIAKGELKIFVQPQCTADGKIRGGEALVRWDHHSEGMLNPEKFIPLFERNGMISYIDRYIWEMAAKTLRKWKDSGFADRYLSVNISPRDFYFVDIYDEFHNLVKKYDIAPSQLKLEITETFMINDIDRKQFILDELHKDGFIIEMDDFGSGYSSLNLLKNLPVDVLKLDMGFLYKARDMDRCRKIIRIMIELAKELDMTVICEGVDDESQVHFLDSVGCDIYQGYYFSKPVPLSNFENLLDIPAKM